MDSGAPQNQAGWVFTPDGQATPPAGQQPPQATTTQPVQPPQPAAPTETSVRIAHNAPAAPAPTPTPAPAAVDTLPEPIAAPAPAPTPEPAPIPEPVAAQPAAPATTFSTSGFAPAAPAPAAPDQVADQLQQDAQSQPSATDDADALSWVANDSVNVQKNGGWFVLLFLGAAMLAIIIYFVTKDIVSVVAIAILAIAVGVVARRQPQSRNYAVTGAGVQIGPKFYPFSTFKSFSVLHEEGGDSIFLLPVKRFMPAMAMYFAPQDESRIIDVLADFLPFEERSHDLVDRFSQKIRF